MTDGIPAALQTDVTRKKSEMFRSLNLKEIVTHADISSDVKHSCFTLERKHFVENVLEC